MKKWLISLLDWVLDQCSFCQWCYKARDSEFLKVITQRAGKSSIHGSDTSPTTWYACIQYFISHLGSHMKAALVLMKAGRHCPRLFMDYSIKIVTHSLNFTPPSYRGKSSINGIINQIVADPQSCKYYQKELHSCDEKFHLMLEKCIWDKYENLKFKLRIHAEIILLDLFYRKDIQFLNGVQYISVSKPSYFLCYQYFQAHPLQVQMSGV